MDNKKEIIDAKVSESYRWWRLMSGGRRFSNRLLIKLSRLFFLTLIIFNFILNCFIFINLYDVNFSIQILRPMFFFISFVLGLIILFAIFYMVFDIGKFFNSRTLTKLVNIQEKLNKEVKKDNGRKRRSNNKSFRKA